ncbi:hypothetical protein ONS95_011018 [Cadophora gregata]|uniref:uncharacterized protein n=1 Tax=Cadophora gregata TaxID=51156 RepID=UPI0026DCAC7A|nr:uncharacterized protein ONS95_011018 [Cadophora gregata]KAK0119578.1 hypothetical protein ONS95_011018 [Cadophora gregata]
MFATAYRAAKTNLKQLYRTDELLELPSQLLPERYSLAQLRHELLGDGQKVAADENDLPCLMILHSCLKEHQRLQRTGDDEDYATELLLWVAKVIFPSSDVATHDVIPEDSTDASRQKAIHTACRKGILGLQSILKLLTLPNIQQQHITTLSEFLISILAFTSPRDCWSTPTSLATAQHLLGLPPIQSSLQAPEFISIGILQEFIRPLFSASKPRTVTSAGRKAMPSSAPVKRRDFNEERMKTPWLYETVYAVTVLEWAVREISTTTLQSSWPLILPPLLTLLDTPGTPILTRGLSLIAILLPKLPPIMLAQTGLASVFSDAIMPITLYLPSITPLPESQEILPLAYAALFALYDVQYTSSSASLRNPPSSTTSTSLSRSSMPPKDKTTLNGESKIAFLTMVLRQCILPAYLHASEHPPIVSILLTQLITLIPKLGIHATQHLKDILPIVSSVLTDPFAAARLSDVTVALQTFQAMVLHCWVRFREELWRREGVRMLVLCWGAMGELKGDGNGKAGAHIDSEVLERVKGEMRVMGRVFAKAVEGSVDLREELKPLVNVDDSIEDLFGF